MLSCQMSLQNRRRHDITLPPERDGAISGPAGHGGPDNPDKRNRRSLASAGPQNRRFDRACGRIGRVSTSNDSPVHEISSSQEPEARRSDARRPRLPRRDVNYPSVGVGQLLRAPGFGRVLDEPAALLAEARDHRRTLEPSPGQTGRRLSGMEPRPQPTPPPVPACSAPSARRRGWVGQVGPTRRRAF